MKNTKHPTIRPRIHPGARNEIKAHIIREGFTMQELWQLWLKNTAGVTAYRISLPN